MPGCSGEKRIRMIKQKTKGDLVAVYSLPFTQQGKEGVAELFKRIPDNRDNEEVENWSVVFVSDSFKCERLINKLDLKYDVPFGYH